MIPKWSLFKGLYYIIKVLNTIFFFYVPRNQSQCWTSSRGYDSDQPGQFRTATVRWAVVKMHKRVTNDTHRLDPSHLSTSSQCSDHHQDRPPQIHFFYTGSKLPTTAIPHSDVTDLKKNKKKTNSLLSGHVDCLKKKSVLFSFFRCGSDDIVLLYISRSINVQEF